MDREEGEDHVPVAEAQSAHPVEPAEGAREPGEDVSEPRPPHPVEPAEGAREPLSDRAAGASA